MTDLSTCLSRLQEENPLVHCISNRVTANDCANILLAIGASPMMAEDARESAELTRKGDALCINLGTLTSEKIPAMLASGKAANEKGIPIIFDPVGVGASSFRMETARLLLSELHISLIRGNLSEIRTVAAFTPMALTLDFIPTPSRGVDTAEKLTDSALFDTVALAMRLSASLSMGYSEPRDHAVVVITGETDIVASPAHAAVLRGGSRHMARVTGTGCMLSCLCAAFAASCREAPLDSALAAVAAMKACGEIAEARMQALDGSGMFHIYLLDAISNLTPQLLNERAKLTRYESGDVL